MYKTLTRIFLQVVIVLLLLELGLRVIYFQARGVNALALVSTLKSIRRKLADNGESRIFQDYKLARPDSSDAVNRAIASESFASNHFSYTPWTEYKNSDFSGRYINVRGLERATVPDRYPAKPGPAKLIYFLGGSTMFGVNVTDRETIAAAFVKEYGRIYPSGAAIKVINYGVPAYHSFNELMLLTRLVYSGELPDAVVVLDGLNDFLLPTAVLERRPYLYYRLRLAGSDKYSEKSLADVNDSTQTLFDYTGSLTEPALADSLRHVYLGNLARIETLANANQFAAFFFIQPNPFYNYPHGTADSISDKHIYPQVADAYRKIQPALIGKAGYFFLGDMLTSEKGYPFIDRFHYSPAMSARIAHEILRQVGPSLNP